MLHAQRGLQPSIRVWIFLSPSRNEPLLNPAPSSESNVIPIWSPKSLPTAFPRHWRWRAGITMALAIPVRFIFVEANHTLGLKPPWEPDLAIHPWRVWYRVVKRSVVGAAVINDFVGREPIFFGSRYQFSRGKIIRISVAPVWFSIRAESWSRRKLHTIELETRVLSFLLYVSHWRGRFKSHLCASTFQEAWQKP